jgi:hypothetical protein
MIIGTFCQKFNNLTLSHPMKKLLLLIILLDTFQIFSQTKYGYKFSIGSTGVDYGTYNKILNTKNGVGFSAGVFADIEAGDDFYLQPTLQVTRHTATVFYKADPSQNRAEYSAIGTEYAVNIPLNMVFKFNSIELGFGPQLNMAFSGPNYFYSSVQSKFGLNFLAGYSINDKSSIQANYSFDFRGDSRIKQSAVYLSFMRTFGK